jgi:hypothetical protein
MAHSSPILSMAVGGSYISLYWLEESVDGTCITRGNRCSGRIFLKQNSEESVQFIIGPTGLHQVSKKPVYLLLRSTLLLSDGSPKDGSVP